MTPELNDRWRPNPSLVSWIAGAFGLAIVLGAAFVTGFLNWPFRAKADPKKQTKATAEISRAVTPPDNAPGNSHNPKSGSDSIAGEVAVAKLWTDIDAKKLAKITAEFRPFELAPILMRMKTTQVAELLAEMPPERASAVSREIMRRTSSP